jgi:hypothetical protein
MTINARNFCRALRAKYKEHAIGYTPMNNAIKTHKDRFGYLTLRDFLSRYYRLYTFDFLSRKQEQSLSEIEFNYLKNNFINLSLELAKKEIK